MKLARIMTTAAAAVLGLVATATSAQEDDNSRFYAGVHHFAWNAETTDGPKVEASGVRLLGGYKLNDYISFEVHIAGGGTDNLQIDSCALPEGCEEAEAELDHLVGVFGRVNLPICDWVNVFGLLGYARGKIDVRSGDESDSLTEESVAVGAGVEVAILPNRLYLSADHVEYINDTGHGGLTKTEASADSLGLRLAFDF